MTKMRLMSREEVARLGTGEGGQPLLVIVNESVLDVTQFAVGHPGGAQVLKNLAGKDVTKEFYALHKHQVLIQRLDRLKVAEVEGFDPKDRVLRWEEISPFPLAEIDMVNSPYYNSSHIKLREILRRFLWESGMYQWCEKAEASGEEPPKDLRRKLGSFGLIALQHGVGEHLKLIPEPNLWSLSGLRPDQVDLFHWGICHQETARMCTPGTVDGLVGSACIGAGPLLNFGRHNPMIQEIARKTLLGECNLSLAVTEPQGGTDVAGTKTSARKLPNGQGYLVNGAKKFITGVCFAHYCTTLVRTDEGQLTVLLIKIRDPESGKLVDGVSVRPIATSYSHSAGTGLLVLENVVVPSDFRLGKEGQGLQIILHNFNMERMMVNATLIGRCRRIIEEAYIWTRQREAFNKNLVDLPTVRLRLGEVTAELNVLDAANERLLYRYHRMTRAEQNEHLGGPTALLKYSVTRGTLRVCDQVCQLFGGRGTVDEGMGSSAYRVAKTFKIFSIGGGTEDAMIDLGVRQTLRTLPHNARL